VDEIQPHLSLFNHDLTDCPFYPTNDLGAMITWRKKPGDNKGQEVLDIIIILVAV
jgi:hypothetical protein